MRRNDMRKYEKKGKEAENRKIKGRKWIKP